MQIKEELDQNVKDCEKERKRLEMLVKSDEMKQELEKEISRLKEEKDSKMLNVHDLKVKIQDYKNRLIHFQKNLKELLVVEEKHRHIQNLVINIFCLLFMKLGENNHLMR